MSLLNQKPMVNLQILFCWIKQVVNSSMGVHDYIKKVTIAETKFIKQWHHQQQKKENQQNQMKTTFDQIQFKYINLLTTFLNINSILVVGGAYAKLKLSWKFIGIFMAIGYIHLSWNLKILEELVKNRINQKETIIRYWHKSYFRDHVGQFLEPKSTNKYRNYLNFDDIYINPIRNL